MLKRTGLENRSLYRKIAMKKTPVVFEIDRTTDLMTNVVKPGQEWVLNGEGVATVKFDGQACLFKDQKLWKRFDRKLSKSAQIAFDNGADIDPTDESNFRNRPEGFVPCEEKPDPVTFHWPGWVPIREDEPSDKWHWEALKHLTAPLEEGATYELVGPTLAKNVYNLPTHQLWRHGKDVVDVPRTFEGMQEFLQNNVVEGLVFHHPDGRKAKIRRKDFKMFWVQDEPIRRKKPRR